MTMQMRHGLASVATIVDHQSVASLFEPHLVGPLRGFQQEMAEQRLVVGFGLRDPRDGLLRYQQHVRWRLWGDVTKSQNQIIFVDDLCRDLASDDFFKESHRDFGFWILDLSIESRHSGSAGILLASLGNATIRRQGCRRSQWPLLSAFRVPHSAFDSSVTTRPERSRRCLSPL